MEGEASRMDGLGHREDFQVAVGSELRSRRRTLHSSAYHQGTQSQLVIVFRSKLSVFSPSTQTNCGRASSSRAKCSPITRSSSDASRMSLIQRFAAFIRMCHCRILIQELQENFDVVLDELVQRGELTVGFARNGEKILKFKVYWFSM